MEQQVFSKDFIIERIKDSGYPFWSLGLWQGFKNVANVMQYYGNDFEDTDTEDTKIEKSIARLVNTVSTFPHESIFVIELKNSRQASGSGIIGPFQFRNGEPPTATAEPATQPLGNIPTTPPTGYVSESMLKGIQESIQHDFDAKLAQYKAQIEKEQQEREYQRKLDDLEQREKEVRDMEKAYNSSVAKAADVLVEVGKRFGSMFLMSKGAAPSATMQAMPNTQLGQPTPPPDEKTAAIDDFAEFLYKNFSAADIRNLQTNIMNYAASQSHMAQQGNDDANGAAAN